MSSLREEFIHEGKKKFAGLVQILDSLERGERLHYHLDYFMKLLSQLMSLLEAQKGNLLLMSDDIFIYGKLRNRLIKIEKRVKRFEKKDNVNPLDIDKTRVNLKKIQDQIETTLNKATERFSFSINEAVKEAVKTVKIEKSDILQNKQITIEETYPEDASGIRLPYYALRDWHKLLANLIRNAVESIELKVESEKTRWVRVSVDQQERDTVGIIIEDSGIGMDIKTKNEFFKRGFTQKETGLGLGITEESVDLVNRYGSWEVESELGKGTEIEIKIEKKKVHTYRIEIEGKRTILQRLFPTPARLVLTALLLIIVGLVIFFSVDKYSRFWVDWNPAYAKVEQGKQVSVFNSHGKELWRHEFERTVFRVEDEKGNQTPLLQIEDLNRDGWKEILVAIVSGVQTPGQLFCLDCKGNIKWIFSAGQSITEGLGTQGKESKSEIFLIGNFLVDNLVNDKTKQILVTSYLKALWPCQLAMLDHKGSIIGEYWHPGRIYFTAYANLNDDEEKELICAGINNKLNCRTVVLIMDIEKFLGETQGPPYNIYDNLKPAKEKKYVIFPHIKDVTWNWVEISPLMTPDYMDIRPDHIFLKFPDGRHYSLTKTLGYISCQHRATSFNNWREKVNFPFEFSLEKDSLSWKDFEIWENGIKVK